MTQVIKVKNKAHLDSLQNHSNGEIAYCEDTKQIYIYNDNEKIWQQFQVNNKGIDLNLYDLNKSIINQLNPLTIDEINLKTSLLEDYYNKTENTYHMLLCRDYNYYTIFAFSVKPEFSNFAEAVITVATELGAVYSLDLNDEGTIEIWIKPLGEESPYAFYLFPYDAGVVYYG